MQQKQIFYYSLPLFGNQFKGNVYNLTQLSAKFQIWCKKNFGINDTSSLCLWIADGNAYYHMTAEEIINNAKSVIDKLPKTTEPIDLSEVE